MAVLVATLVARRQERVHPCFLAEALLECRSSADLSSEDVELPPIFGRLGRHRWCGTLRCLPVVRRLAERHGALLLHVSVHQRLGCCAARLELPCCSPSTAQSWSLPMVAVRAVARGKHLTRDHAGCRREACAFAGRRSVARAMDGTSAVERFQRASSTHTSMSGELLRFGMFRVMDG